MKRFEVKEDKKNKFYIWDNQNQRVITGNIDKGEDKEKALGFTKSAKEVTEPKIPSRNKGSNHDRVVALRSSKQGVTPELYKAMYPKGIEYDPNSKSL